MRKKEKDEDIVVFSEDDLHTTEDELELSKKIEKEEHTSGNSNEEDKKDIFMEDIEDYSDFEDCMMKRSQILSCKILIWKIMIF